jgi:hypothetical protein
LNGTIFKNRIKKQRWYDVRRKKQLRERKQANKKSEHTVFVLFSRELFWRHIEHGAPRETCVFERERFLLFFFYLGRLLCRGVLTGAAPCVITCAEIKIGARFN